MVSANELWWVREDVAVWRAYEPAVKCDVSSSALMTPEGLVLIDPIPLCEEALTVLAGRAKPRAILLTSGNHARAAEEFARRFGIPICAPRAAVVELGVSVDVELAEGEAAPGELLSVAIPAAGPGEVAYVGRNVVCIGDAVINLGPLALLPAKYCAEATRLPEDLRKLLSYDFDILTFAHGEPLVANARDRLQQLLA
jgi:glyoxylase-like metal-dependent hydrolase (beta-lactamase superfamily II)